MNNQENGSNFQGQVNENSIPLREGVFARPDVFSTLRIAAIFEEKSFDRRMTFVDVEGRIGGQIVYKDSQGVVHPLDICLQKTQKDGVVTMFFSAENEWEGFTHLPINEDNKVRAFSLLLKNIRDMAVTMQLVGIDITSDQLVGDVLNSIQQIDDKRLFLPSN